MSIWDRLKKELIDIVEFLDDTNNTLCYRFERFQNEIKNGAKCIVREGQAAVFINEGRIADVLSPGTYTLDTRNVPVLATLLGWKYGFESPFKAEVYFVSTRLFTDLKWGTMNPVMVRDPEFGPVRLRAYGTYAIRVKDPGVFIRNVVGTDNRLTTDEITNQLRNLIVSHFGEAIGQANIPMLDLAANYRTLGGRIGEAMKGEFDRLGVELSTLLIENISLPQEVEAALDKRSSMSVIGDVGQYAKFQAADALKEAAKNPGTAGMVVGMGVGGALGATIGQTAQQAAVPPPVPAFFLVVQGQQRGPFAAGALADLVRSGQLTRSTLVWRQGMAQWAPAQDVPELAAIIPPPPPVGA
jgi:membrane protease subunit (stomatin/prohibitin family)